VVILQTWLAETVDVMFSGRTWASYRYALYASCICGTKRILVARKTAICMCMRARMRPDMILLIIF
jgi:hypothetical protein